MGELFESCAPETQLTWTGERLTGGAGAQVEIEHLHRYLLARQIARGLDVIDVASGEGYGSAFLAQTARSVLGIELDSAAVDHAVRSYHGSNLRFLQGDARSLPADDASADLVVSFETIEHFHEHETFLAEVCRVLRPGGRLLISSPDRDTYTPAGSPANPFHVHELTRNEFAALLGRFFGNVQLQGQRTIVGSVLISESQNAAGHLSFERRADRFESSNGLPRPVYLVALASDDSSYAFPESLFLETSAIDAALTELPALRLLGEQRSAALDEAGVYARKLEAELTARDQAAAQASLQAVDADQTRETAMTAAGRAATEAAQHWQAEAEASRTREDAALTAAEAAQDRQAEAELNKAAAEAELAAAREALHAAHEDRTRAEEETAAAYRAAEATREEHVRTEARQSREAAAAGRRRVEQYLITAKSENKALQSRVNTLGSDNASLGAALDASTRRITELEGIASSLSGLEVELRHSQLAMSRLSTELQTVLSSGTWRATQPFRSVLTRTPGLRGFLRRSVKVVWWTGSLQLPSRLALRRRAKLQQMLTIDAVSIIFNAAQSDLALEAISSQPTTLAPIQVAVVETAQIDQPAPDPEGDKTALVARMTDDLFEFLDSDERLRFEHAPHPTISVLIVVWNKAYFLHGCLRALQTTDQQIEIIVVDNASSDETAELLARINDVTVIRNEVNEGFLLATNRAACAARGENLLLLNSDAFVRPGAITAALSTLRSSSDIGAVGGRLILPNGRLQEAGSVIWSDASTLGYARGVDPEAGEAMFRRDVDYCSGAFLLTRRDIWERFGGLDPIYAPAYYEEADYCLRLWDAGWRTVYEPQAVIDHFEFGSEGLKGDVVTASLRNRRLFRHRHTTRLLTRHLPNGIGNALTARHAALARTRRRLLVVDDFIPMASLGSGFPRAQQILAAALADGWAITLYPMHQTTVDWLATRQEISAEIEVVVNGGPHGLAPFLGERAGYFDTVLVSRPHNMKFLRDLGGADVLAHGGVQVIYDAEALFSLREIEQERVFGVPLGADEAELRIQSELDLCAGSNAVICVSESEAEVFRARLPERPVVPVHVLSYPATARQRTPQFDARRGFLFVGRLLEKPVPNWDGLTWFLRECWPLIREALPEATLSIVGRISSDCEELKWPGVHLVGPVDDLAPVFDATRVFIAPIRYAAGVPIKILEAVAAGVPCAGTRLMARQMNFTPDVEMVAEDDAHALAQGAVALHEQMATWNTIRQAASERVKREHGQDRFQAELRRALIGSDRVPPRALTSGSQHQMSEDTIGCVDAATSDAYRVARVAAIWNDTPPKSELEQWARFPLSHPLVKAAMNRRATGNTAHDGYSLLHSHIVAAGIKLPLKQTVSLCCGAGAVERDLVRRGLISHCVGYDLAPEAIAAARSEARAEEFSGLTYAMRDLERDGLLETQLDLIIGHQGIHHLSRLESLFDAVHAALRPGGLFHLDEFVGPDRFQWTERQLEEMTTWLLSLPERYRTTTTGAIKNCTSRETVETMIAHDPSEAVRSSDIERLVQERFEIVEHRSTGGTLTMMALADIGHNFDPNSAEAVFHIERLIQREDALIASGELRSDFAVVIARRPNLA